MSINLVVVAVIALIILVVMLIIFTGKTKMFGKSTMSCAVKQGTCMPAPCKEGYLTQTATDCETGQSCCVAVEAGVK